MKKLTGRKIMELMVVFVSIICGAGLIYLLKFFLYQSSISITPAEAIDALVDSGYEITELDLHPETQYSITKYEPIEIITFVILQGEEDLSIRLIFLNSIFKSQILKINQNQINKSVKGNYANSFCLGKLVIQVYPTDKELGKELLKVIQDYYFRD